MLDDSGSGGRAAGAGGRRRGHTSSGNVRISHLQRLLLLHFIIFALFTDYFGQRFNLLAFLNLCSLL